jgi:hypothetical protein
MILLELVLFLTAIYSLVGVVFAAYFVVFQITKYDKSAIGTNIFFRLTIFFGAIVFWLILALQIYNNKDRIEVTAHRL